VITEARVAECEAEGKQGRFAGTIPKRIVSEKF